MRKALIALGIAGFLGVLIVYILYNFSPYDNAKLVDMASIFGVPNAIELTDNINNLIDYGLIFSLIDPKLFYILLVLSFVFTLSFVSGVHMLIDKLFYKKFYEEPKTWPALRRGLLVYIILLSLVLFRLIGVLSILNALSILVMGVIAEVLLIKFTKKS